MFVIKEDGEFTNPRTGKTSPYTSYFEYDAGFALGWCNEVQKAKKYNTRAQAVKDTRKYGLYARKNTMIEIEKVA